MSERGGIFDEVYSNPDFQAIVVFVMQYRDELITLQSKKRKTPRDPIYTPAEGLVDGTYDASVINLQSVGSTQSGPCKALSGRGVGLSAFDPGAFAAGVQLGRPQYVQDDNGAQRLRKYLTVVEHPYLDPYSSRNDAFPYAQPDGHDFFGRAARRVIGDVAYSFCDGKVVNTSERTELGTPEHAVARLVTDLLWQLDMGEVVTLETWQSHLRIAIDSISRGLVCDGDNSSGDKGVTTPGPSSSLKTRGNLLTASVFEMDRSTRLVARDWRVYAEYLRDQGGLTVELQTDSSGRRRSFVNVLSEHRTLQDSLGEQEIEALELVAERRGGDKVSVDPLIINNATSKHLLKLDSEFLLHCTEPVVDLMWPTGTIEVQLERPFFTLSISELQLCVRQLCDTLLLKLKLTGDRQQPGMGGNVWVWQRKSDGLVTACVDIHGELPAPHKIAKPVAVNQSARIPLKSVTIEVIGSKKEAKENNTITKAIPKNSMMARFLGFGKNPSGIANPKEEKTPPQNHSREHAVKQELEDDIQIVNTVDEKIDNESITIADDASSAESIAKSKPSSLLSLYNSKLKQQKYLFYPICSTVSDLSSFGATVGSIFPDLADAAQQYQREALLNISNIQEQAQKAKDDQLWIKSSSIAARQSRSSVLQSYLSSDSEEEHKPVIKKRKTRKVVEDVSASECSSSSSSSSDDNNSDNE